MDHWGPLLHNSSSHIGKGVLPRSSVHVLTPSSDDFCALGFGAMAPDDDADLHASAQAARLSLNNVSVRSLAWLAAVAS